MSEGYYVLIWREGDTSRRLRTYTSGTGRPLASPMKHIFPTPEKIIAHSSDLNAWLNSPVDDDVVAVAEQVAREELGWDPQRLANMKDGYE